MIAEIFTFLSASCPSPLALQTLAGDPVADCRRDEPPIHVRGLHDVLRPDRDGETTKRLPLVGKARSAQRSSKAQGVVCRPCIADAVERACDACDTLTNPV